ncbi:hypothetical protein CDAR_413121 [Caerostris darwini]|uniref:Uncharacterized protein n=1 Tax=Caerostris darwini TaxID=1538125 RepID=A0AAV4R688_9ARAC|nr:hypothetical protein CDAR_413121 [Caerostris darwini]
MPQKSNRTATQTQIRIEFSAERKSASSRPIFLFMRCEENSDRKARDFSNNKDEQTTLGEAAFQSWALPEFVKSKNGGKQTMTFCAQNEIPALLRSSVVSSRPRDSTPFFTMRSLS